MALMASNRQRFFEDFLKIFQKSTDKIFQKSTDKIFEKLHKIERLFILFDYTQITIHQNQ
jgi:hypothetical protein